METSQSLSTEARTLASFLGAFRLPVSRTKLGQFAHQLGFRGKLGRAYRVPQVRAWVDELIAAGWVTLNPSKAVSATSDRRAQFAGDLLDQYAPDALRAALEGVQPEPKENAWYFRAKDTEAALNHAWLALVLNDEERLLTLQYRMLHTNAQGESPSIWSLVNDLGPDGLAHLPFRSLRHALAPGIRLYTLLALEAEPAVHRAMSERASEWSDALAWALGLSMIARGEASAIAPKLDELCELRRREEGAADAMLLGTRAAVALVGDEADVTRVATSFDKALRAFGKEQQQRKIMWPDILGFFHLSALLSTGKDKDHTRAQRLKKLLRVPRELNLAERQFMGFFDPMMRTLLEDDGVADSVWSNESTRICPWDTLFVGVARQLMGLPLDPALLKRAGADAKKSEEAGYPWLADRLANLKTKWVLSGAKLPEPWERDLDALERLVAEVTPGKGSSPALAAEPAERIVFLLDPDLDSEFDISPRLQKRNKKGWSKGRKIALKSLFESRPECATSEDDRVIQHIVTQVEPGYGYHRNIYYAFDDRAHEALIGHPRVALSTEPTHFVPVEKRSVSLSVVETKNGVELSFTPDVEQLGSVRLEPDGSIGVYQLTTAQRKVARELASAKRAFPKKARERLGTLLSSLAQIMPVEAGALGASTDAEAVAADATPRFRLRREQDGLRVQVRVCPLGEDGPAFVPGEGAERVLGQRDARTVQAKRNLTSERARADAAVADCSTLVDELPGATFILPTTEDSLDLLVELRSLAERGHEVIVQWPEGESFRLRHADKGGVRVRMTERGDWLEPRGEVKVDGQQVIEMRLLLAALAERPSRYIELEDGSFLALERALQSQLSAVAAFALPPSSKNAKLRVHPLAALVMPALSENARVGGNPAFLARLARAKDAESMDAPVPPGLRAELRPYQLEGYRWLVRLGMLGAGACLADDMGLGKTVQALALLLHRAGEGPALVVAPTSVCGNWREEALRFAPDLRLHQLRGPEALDDLSQLGASDVLVVSYGVVVREIERLAEIRFGTVVLDEAQNIKNAATARAKAVCALNAAMRVATTGTPIENHLGELHSLFGFLEPGLLGSREGFRKRFADPIERQHDATARLVLRDRVTPLILRRTKAKVLEELPSRTDVTLRIDPSPEQAAFYEALRQRMAEELEASREEGGAAHLRVLAALTRLRQACCHPKLVAPEVDVPSAKMAAFLELLDELREGRHRALVFSQFVRHLALVREQLDERKITYQYLDGSTPARQRDERVRAFQSGEGDVFLISLKAGGTGLNLTGADYVVHLDPWWNPAVEDQATDRAHRIGQTRPVTAYRLILRDTVEERIVEMHHQKRDLAEQLLSGTDRASRLSLKDMLDLIRG